MIFFIRQTSFDMSLIVSTFLRSKINPTGKACMLVCNSLDRLHGYMQDSKVSHHAGYYYAIIAFFSYGLPAWNYSVTKASLIRNQRTPGEKKQRPTRVALLKISVHQVKRSNVHARVALIQTSKTQTKKARSSMLQRHKHPRSAWR